MLGLFSQTPPPPSRFPDGRVGYAVGDVHGRADLLAALSALLEIRAASDRCDGGAPLLIFLGDYVDRGPNSAGVIDFLANGKPGGFERRFLMGNHEQSMLAFMEAPVTNQAWLLHGGVETLISYGVAPPPPMGANDRALLAAAEQLRSGMPASHLEFLTKLERYIELGDYLFVHAGVNLDEPLELQTDKDLFWSRVGFVDSKRPYSHRVVHGHTPSAKPHCDARRVGVDTGAYASGTLTAARFEGEEVAFLNVSDPSSRRPAALHVEF